MQRKASKRKSAKAEKIVHPHALSYSLDEAAAIVGVSRRTIYNLINDGVLESRKIRSRRVIPRAALEELLKPKAKR